MKKTHAYLYRDVDESKVWTPSRKENPLRDVSNVSMEKQKVLKQKATSPKHLSEENSAGKCDFLLKLKVKTGEDGTVFSVWTKRYFYIKANERGPVLFYAKDATSEPAGCKSRDSRLAQE